MTSETLQNVVLCGWTNTLIVWTFELRVGEVEQVEWLGSGSLLSSDDGAAQRFVLS